MAAFVAILLISIQPAAAQNGGSSVQQEIINGVIQNIIQNVRDQIQRRRIVAPAPGALRFNGEDGQFDNRSPFASNNPGNPFAALAYAKSPIMAPAPVSVWLYGANLIGSGDKALTYGTETHITTVTGAFDVTKIGIFTATDALTFIGTGSNSWASATATIPLLGQSLYSTIPSTSGTLSYLNGGFSADFTALASWTNVTPPSPLILIPNSSSISYTGNAQYRFDFAYSMWIEPTAGVTYTEVYTANFGTKLADTTEVHGGARIGTEMKWMGFTVQPSLSGAVFKTVDSNISTLPIVAAVAAAGAPPGLLGGRGSGKINVIWTPNFSSYIEAHGSGLASTKTNQLPLANPAATQTIGAQAGLRYSW